MGLWDIAKKGLTFAGTAMGGPVGGLAVGAGLGILGSALGKKRGGGGGQAPGTAMRSHVAGQLTKDAYGPLDQTASYQAQRAELRDMLSRQGQADSSTLAARGQQGGEMEIAMRSQRGRQMTQGLLGATQNAEQSRRGALNGLLGIAGAEDANYWQRKQLKAQRDAQKNGLLGGAIGAAVPSLIDWASGGGKAATA